MRLPFDASDGSWWAIHGASRAAPAPRHGDLEFEREIDPIAALADELLALPASAGRSTEDASAMLDAQRHGLSPQELIEAMECETVRDVSLVRTAAALAETWPS